MVKMLQIMRPFMAILPEVEPPEQGREIRFNERVLWTAVTLGIYLICCQIPLFGIPFHSDKGDDALYWMRMIMAGNRGTLMELGITPIVTSGMIMQLIVGAKAMDVDMTIPEDRQLFQGMQKLCALVMCLGQAVVYVMTGNYGIPGEIGAGVCLLIILQLFFAGITVLLLDEMLQKGYGLGSGISLFISTNICEMIMWRAFSPQTVFQASGRGPQFEGAVVSFVHGLFYSDDKLGVFMESMTRPNLPNMTSIINTVFIFGLCIYLQGFKVELPIKSTVSRGSVSTLPVQLFYTRNIPIIMQSALVSQLFIISQFLYNKYTNNFLVTLLGTWENEGFRQVPTSGICYYMSSPTGLTGVVEDPFRFATYATFVCCSCAMFSRLWVDVSGQAPRDIAKQLKQQNLQIFNHAEKSNLKILEEYIPTAALLGGLLIGALSVMADLMGVIGSGTGILLSVTIIFAYYEIWAKEQQKNLAAKNM